MLLSNSGKRAGAERAADRSSASSRAPGTCSSAPARWRGANSPDETARPALKPGTRCLLLARDNDRSAVDGLDLELVDERRDGRDSCCSPAARATAHARALRDLLAPAAKRGVPMLLYQPGQDHADQGRPALWRWADRGALRGTWRQGRVDRQAVILRSTKPRCGWPAIPIAPVVCIGDSIEHDIAGAKGAGLSAALVRSGILADLTCGRTRRALCRAWRDGRITCSQSSPLASRKTGTRPWISRSRSTPIRW